MNKLSSIKMIYSSPAVPPKRYEIHLGWIYTLYTDKRGSYIDDGNLEQVIPLSLIQQMFSPIDATWQALLEKK